MGLPQNESEHRRGLVLGLTLAEIMLLLLFVLLLTLGKLISDQAKQAEAANDQVADLRLVFTKFKPILDQIKQRGESADLDILIGELAQLSALKSTNESLKSDNDAMRSELEIVRKLGPNSAEKIAAVEEAFKSAARVNPDDPPEALRRAIELIKEFGPNLDSEMMELVREASQNKERFQAVLEKAKANPKLVDADKGKHKWPPIITLSDAEGYSFKVGSAELSQKFRDKLRGKITDQLLHHIAEYDVDIIEVVGHTDETRYGERTSNLDNALPDVVLGKSKIDIIIPADNAGLGLARAVSVARFLQQDRRLKVYSILPYSGGQLIGLDDTMSDGLSKNEDGRRRRIELRVRQKRKSQAKQLQQSGLSKDSTAAHNIPLPIRKQVWELRTQRNFSGQAFVVDGDDIIIDGQDYRLEGVDAFERNQVCRMADGRVEHCGHRAKTALAAIIAEKQVTCTPTGKRHRKRLIANCTAAGLDVEVELVRSGWAFVRPDFLSRARSAELCAVEVEAKLRKAGAWAGEFELPYFQKGGSRKSRDEVSCPP